MDYNKIIGANIRYERKKRDLTIEELSDLLGIAAGFLGLIERGQRGTSIKNLCKIANFFSLTLDELITRYIDENMMEVSESEESEYTTKKLSASSYVNNLDETELDLVLSFFKSLKRYNRRMFNKSSGYDDEYLSDDDEDYEDYEDYEDDEQ